ncbi:MAG: hypothetical protein WCL27_09060 [Betaproteobacteria bacterium]
MGRPVVPAGEKRNEKITACFTQAERNQILTKATEAHLPLGTFLRKSALGHPIQTLPVINAQRWAELARTTANLNAMAAKIHRGEISYLPAEVLDELREQVESVRRLLMGEAP